MDQANVTTTELSNLTDSLAANTAPSFAVGGGIVSTDVGGFHPVSEQVVAVQADGKILLGGSVQLNGKSDYDFVLLRYNTDGSLDSSFDGDGIVTIAGFQGSSFTVQADGKILLTGGSGYPNYDFALMRYTPDGSLDSSFGSDGIVTTNVGYDSYSQSITVQADGKILLGGSANMSKARGYDFALVRYNADGSLDLSFDGNGIVTTDLGNSYEFGASITVQADGKILLGGNSTLLRYNSDGSVDSSFDGDGRVSANVSAYGYVNAYSVTLQADGKILLGGHSRNYDFALMRYNTDGSLDLSFDNDGIVTPPRGTGDSVTVQADGKILLGGSSVARYNIDGSLDLSFAVDGIASIAGISGSSVAVQANGKILLGGTSYHDGYSSSDFALVRYNTDGSLDNSFNPNPVNTLNSKTISYYNDNGAVLDNAVQIYDAELADQGNYNGASITLARHGGANAEDVFSSSLFSGSDVILSGVTVGAVSNSNGTLSITFNSKATQVRADAILSSIAYHNSADYPFGPIDPTDTPAPVQMDWTFSDGNTGSQGIGGALTTTASILINMLGNRGELRGTTGDDNLVGGWTVRAVYGFAGNDNLSGKDRDVIVDGGEGNDTLNGGLMLGGLGDDTYIAYQGRRSHDVVIENLNEGTDTINSVSGYYHLPDNVENLTLTSSNSIGGKGNDLANTLIGNDRDNRLSGGAGADTLSGGLGADVFKFNTEAETGIAETTRDSIVDFSHDQGDKINLSAFDANTALKGNNAFAAPTVGNTFSGTFVNSGELYFDQTAHILYGNNDTDTVADFSIMVMGVTNLVAADFVL